jgi:hypothetical protein
MFCKRVNSGYKQALEGVKLKLRNGDYAIHRFEASGKIPGEVFRCDFFHVTQTDEAISIVCPSFLALNSQRCNKGWTCIEVLGPLDFSLTGILAKLSGVLAEAKISIFAISTYDTDFILVKAEKIDPAVAALKAAGYIFT